MRLSTVIPIILALTTMSAGAAMYKWTDADGNTQYGQHPPAGVQAERVKPAPQPTSQGQPTLTPQQRLQQLEEQQQKEREAEAEAAAGQEKAEIAKKNCKIAKQNRANLQMGGHRLTRLSDGSYTRLTEEERLSRIAEAEKNIEKYCR
jgi:type IV secretory pathway VirB10-like protein